MTTRYCTTCFKITAGWHHPSGPADSDALTAVSRASAAALFGLHVASAHPEAEAPDPKPHCDDCQAWTAAVAHQGPNAAVAGCGETAGQLLRQHLLSHDIENVPVFP
jgi:hypothetical protein